jgi:hypothetical protein
MASVKAMVTGILPQRLTDLVYKIRILLMFSFSSFDQKPLYFFDGLGRDYARRPTKEILRGVSLWHFDPVTSFFLSSVA